MLLPVKLRDDINEKLRPGGEKQIVTATDLKLTYSSWRDAEKDSKFPDKKMYQFHVIIDVTEYHFESNRIRHLQIT